MTTVRTTPTLDDVASAAGVSTATVSRCLNFPQMVQEKTRQRVLKAVEELGYTPNFGARVMAAKRTHTIGAIVPTMENAIFARGLQAFQEELHERGYTLLVASSAYRRDLEEEQIRNLVARGADGLLLIGQDRDPAVYRYLKRQDISAVIAWTHSADAPLPCIGFDNRVSMRRLAEEAIARGHRRIAMISGILDGNDRAQMRLAGIKDAMAAHGLDTGTLAVVETPYDVEGGYDALGKLLSVETRPTVVFCGNDVLAVGALRRARQLGIDVPGELSITGFDDLEIARIAQPELTTVHVPHREMGRKAACELIALIENDSTGRSIELQAPIRIRGSLGSCSD